MTPDLTIDEYQITRFDFPRDRVIGDSQVRSERISLASLELITKQGQVGLGFFFNNFFPLPALTELKRWFEVEIAPQVLGQNPFSLANRLARPRGGNIQSLPHHMGQAIDQALWDLQGKVLDLPLYRLLGGRDEQVLAYASCLGFHLTHTEVASLFQQAVQMGFKAFKVKVGHRDLDWDLTRLTHVVEVVGPEARLMIDANEAWSPKEAIYRLHAYREAGFNIYWVEDPCLRDDFVGLAQVAQAVPFCRLNTGEYLSLHDKHKLIEHRAVDILNVHGHIGDTLKAAWLAAEYGLPISLGNTPFELGVHLAAALPEVEGIEYSFMNYNHLLQEPIQFINGYALAPDRPGHGLALSAEARTTYARPDFARPEDRLAEFVPPAPVKLGQLLKHSPNSK